MAICRFEHCESCGEVVTWKQHFPKITKCLKYHVHYYAKLAEYDLAKSGIVCAECLKMTQTSIKYALLKAREILPANKPINKNIPAEALDWVDQIRLIEYLAEFGMELETRLR